MGNLSSARVPEAVEACFAAAERAGLTVNRTPVSRNGDVDNFGRIACPAVGHPGDRSDANVSVGAANDTLLLYGFSCDCTRSEMLEALGLVEYLPRRSISRDSTSAVDAWAIAHGIDLCQPVLATKSPGVERYAKDLRTGRYRYPSEDGTIRLYKRRVKQEGGKKIYVWKRCVAGEWRNGLGEHTPALYGSDVRDEIVAAGYFFLVEGESSAATLISRGYPAVSGPDGAGSKWSTALEDLALRVGAVIVIADRDEKGLTYAHRMRQEFRRLGVAYQVVHSATHRDRDDVVDHFDAGFGLCDLVPIDELQSWPRIVPLDASYCLPAFPTDALPDWLRQTVIELARETATPEDLAGMAVLAIISAAVSKAADIRVRQGWIEYANLCNVVVLPPGNRKSAVITALLRPVEEVERRLLLAHRAETAKAESELRIGEERLRAAERKAAKNPTDAASELGDAREAIEKLTVGVAPRLLAEDSSPEAIVTLLVEQRGTLAVVSTEGDLFDII
jgi:hypothetical protein